MRRVILLVAVLACGADPETGPEGGGGTRGVGQGRRPPEVVPDDEKGTEAGPCGPPIQYGQIEIPVECDPYYVEKGRPPEDDHVPFLIPETGQAENFNGGR